MNGSPWKIYECCLMCSYSHYQIYWLKVKPLSWNIHPSPIQIVWAYDRTTLCILECTQQSGWPPGHYKLTLAVSCTSRLPWYHTCLTHNRQCQVLWHWSYLWHLTTCSSYSVAHIINQTPVPVIWPHTSIGSTYVHPGTYATQSLDLWSDTHHDQKIILAELRLQPALTEVYDTCHWRPIAHC